MKEDSKVFTNSSPTQSMCQLATSVNTRQEFFRQKSVVNRRNVEETFLSKSFFTEIPDTSEEESRINESSLLARFPAGSFHSWLGISWLHLYSCHST